MERLQEGKKNKSKAKETTNPQPCKEICEKSATLFPLRHKALKNTLLMGTIILKDEN